jgi:hypothetical protein
VFKDDLKERKKMALENWTKFKYDGSPYYISSPDHNHLNQMIGLIEKGYPTDLAISEVLTTVAVERQIFILKSLKPIESEKYRGAMPDDLEFYFFGFVAPLTLTKAAFLWIISGESDAREYIKALPAQSKRHDDFKSYLTDSLPLCYEMLQDVKDCRIIVEHTRQMPVFASVYFRVGVEAAENAFILYAVEIAGRQLKKEMGLDDLKLGYSTQYIASEKGVPKMKNPALAKKLEGSIVKLPSDYKGKVLGLDISPDVLEYADGVVHNIDEVASASTKPFSAMHVVAICMTTIIKMVKASFSKTQVLAAYEITPEYLAIMIPDELIRHDSIRYFNEEMTDLVSMYVKR